MTPDETFHLLISRVDGQYWNFVYYSYQHALQQYTSAVLSRNVVSAAMLYSRSSGRKIRLPQHEHPNREEVDHLLITWALRDGVSDDYDQGQG